MLNHKVTCRVFQQCSFPHLNLCLQSGKPFMPGWFLNCVMKFGRQYTSRMVDPKCYLQKRQGNEVCANIYLLIIYLFILFHTVYTDHVWLIIGFRNRFPASWTWRPCLIKTKIKSFSSKLWLLSMTEKSAGCLSFWQISEWRTIWNPVNIREGLGGVPSCRRNISELYQIL